MKIIDLLNKIANGEINEDIEIECQYGYYFEYCNIRNFFDKYIVDKENLNQEIKLVKSLEEEKKIPEKLENYSLDEKGKYPISPTLYEGILKNKINEIIDYLKNKGDE